jgi:hypothetical protein
MAMITQMSTLALFLPSVVVMAAPTMALGIKVG